LTQYYTATTLDGFIADPNDSLGWLFTRDQDHDGSLNYRAFIADVGALAMGSTTYEWILDHEFADKDPVDWRWPYEIPGWVFTHRDLRVVPDAAVEFTNDPVETVHARMVETAGGKNVWLVGGGDLVGQFAEVGLLADFPLRCAEQRCLGRALEVRDARQDHAFGQREVEAAAQDEQADQPAENAQPARGPPA